ncbi:hypothetical protein V5799_005189 [Amblyomma americanum]|uniref:Uncharacterized protein n=1 Tax=Amblyomma americanum TaxID=6943 RepID=A0AAQ4DZY9_AMBAM
MNRLDETMEGMSSNLRSRATGKHRRVGSVDCTRSLHQLYSDANRILELQSQAQGFVSAVQRPDAAQSSSGATPPPAHASPQVAAPGMVVTIPVDAGEKSSILFLDTTAEASSPGADGAVSDSLLYKTLDSSFRYPAICVPSPRFESCSPIAPQATTTPLRPERPEVPTPHSRNERRAVSPKNPRHAGEKKLQADPVFLPPAGGQQDALGKKKTGSHSSPKQKRGPGKQYKAPPQRESNLCLEDFPPLLPAAPAAGNPLHTSSDGQPELLPAAHQQLPSQPRDGAGDSRLAPPTKSAPARRADKRKTRRLAFRPYEEAFPKPVSSASGEAHRPAASASGLESSAQAVSSASKEAPPQAVLSTEQGPLTQAESLAGGTPHEEVHRANTQASSALPSNPAPMAGTSQAALAETLGTKTETVLFRPRERKGNFLALSREVIGAQLSKLPGVSNVRVNFRRNVVAVDAEPSAQLEPLLAVAEIGDVRVRARVASTNTCAGIIYAVDGNVPLDEVLDNMESKVPILGCSRSGRNIVVRFAGVTPPEEIALFKLRRTVRACLPRPVQCAKCGALGHATATCRAPTRCLRCGGPHATKECAANKPRCINCGGPHDAKEPRCPRWQQERKVATLLVTSKRPITRREATRTVRAQISATTVPSREAASKKPRWKPTSNIRDGTTFSEALAGKTASSQPIHSSAPPDAKDAVIAALTAAVRALVDHLPADSIARQLCTAALAAQESLAQHG